ncbi:hypothetical protein BV20DRAFT_1052684 [Pilatotrama ljubarskyi]|nr:hypothetical protein BV20DRAFT_1052684 [Pilatotrama ljubarskyi]
MSSATKDLTFWSRDLGKNVTLLLCFMPPSPDMLVNQFPVAWKVVTLSATGESVLDVTVASQLGFCMPQIGGGQNTRILSAGCYTAINNGETTTLEVTIPTEPPVYSFTPPVPFAESKSVQAKNDTGSVAPIALGLVYGMGTSRQIISPILAWPSIAQGTSIETDFTPILRVYIAQDYQESEIIKADIQEARLIWEANVAHLGPKTRIHIVNNGDSGFAVRTTPYQRE